MRFDFVFVCAVLVCVSDKPYEQLPGERGREKLRLAGRNVIDFQKTEPSFVCFARKHLYFCSR